MRILYALILTLIPPFLGMGAFYLTLYPYSFDELQYTIIRQLYYLNHYWVLIQWGVNWYFLRRLVAPKKSAPVISIKK